MELEALGGIDGLPVREIVVTHGSHGATLHAGGRTEEIPAFPMAGDPTGAGDAFSIAYLSARAGGHRPVPAARRASALVSALLATGAR